MLLTIELSVSQVPPPPTIINAIDADAVLRAKLCQARQARERAAAKQRLRVNMLQCVYTVRATAPTSTLEAAYMHAAKVWKAPFDALRTPSTKRAASETTLALVAKAAKDMYYRWTTLRTVSPLTYKRVSVSDVLVGDPVIHAELVAWVLKHCWLPMVLRR